MADADSANATAAGWLELEHSIERLHAAARSPIDVREFYRRLLAEATAATGAVGGAAWRTIDGEERLELVCRSLDADADVKIELDAARRQALLRTVDSAESEIVASGSAGGRYECLICPVAAPAETDEDDAKPQAAAFELWLPGGGSPLVKQGWVELGAAIADVASDFHALDELRRLREGAALNREAIGLLKRVQTPRHLVGAAFELANEGRRVLGCDRLCVVMRARSAAWAACRSPSAACGCSSGCRRATAA